MNILKKIFITYFIAIILLFQAQESITIIGLGRLGLTMALCFENAGFSVLGVDIFQDYVDSINNKTFRSDEPLVNEYLQKNINLKATTSLAQGLSFSDIYFIVVDTPSGSQEAYDHSKLSKLLSNINKHKIANKHIVIACTIFPGYVKNIASYILRDCQNISISYNPEFIAQGSIITNFENPDMILIGEGSREVGDKLESIYGIICKNNPIIKRMSPESAEIAKLAVNCFITTKIAYANMIGEIADRTIGANKYDILAAVGADSRIGCKCLNPGYGFGGPCFPRDNRALGNYAEKIGMNPIIPYSTDSSNKLHAQYIAQDLMKKNLDLYIFEDVNYKDNCPVVILEESQKLAVATLISSKGHRVLIRDRAEVINQVQQKFGNIFEYETI